MLCSFCKLSQHHLIHSGAGTGTAPLFSFTSGQWLLPYTFPHVLFMADLWCYKSYKYDLWHRRQGFEHQCVSPARPQGWGQNTKTHQVSVRQWGTTVGRENVKDPRGLLLASLHSYFLLPSPCLSHEAASQAGQQPPLWHHSPEPAFQGAPVKAALLPGEGPALPKPKACSGRCNRSWHHSSYCSE